FDQELNAQQRICRAQDLIDELIGTASQTRKELLQPLTERLGVLRRACGISQQLSERLDQLRMLESDSPRRFEQWRREYEATREYFDSEVASQDQELRDFVKGEAVKMASDCIRLAAMPMADDERTNVVALGKRLRELVAGEDLEAMRDTLALIDVEGRLAELQGAISQTNRELTRRGEVASQRLKTLQQQAVEVEVELKYVACELEQKPTQDISVLKAQVQAIESAQKNYEEKLLGLVLPRCEEQSRRFVRCRELLIRHGREFPPRQIDTPSDVDAALQTLHYLHTTAPRRESEMTTLGRELEDEAGVILNHLEQTQPIRPEQLRERDGLRAGLMEALANTVEDPLLFSQQLERKIGSAKSLLGRLTEQLRQFEDDLKVAKKQILMLDEIGVPEEYQRLRDRLSALVDGVVAAPLTMTVGQRSQQLEECLPEINNLVDYIARLASDGLHRDRRLLESVIRTHPHSAHVKAIDRLLAESKDEGGRLIDREIRYSVRLLAERLRREGL
ncbi:MAG: hypothetical protein HN348_17995, partial [Proteobacteria bacterium]|nr:hypothetical protein [Pseudomonadota bacterium]